MKSTENLWSSCGVRTSSRHRADDKSADIDTLRKLQEKLAFLT